MKTNVYTSLMSKAPVVIKVVFYAGTAATLVANKTIVMGGGLKLGACLPTPEQAEQLIEGVKLIAEGVSRL